MRKKILALLAVFGMALVVAGCGSGNEPPSDVDDMPAGPPPSGEGAGGPPNANGGQ